MTSMFDLSKSSLNEQLQSLVKNIVAALVEYKKCNKKFITEQYRHYKYDEKKKVRIEDLL